MAINFPNSPGIGSVFTDATAGFSYEWDGTLWKSYAAASSSNIKILDDISSSFNGSTLSFPITSGAVSITPVNAQQLDINLGGIIQAPGTDYTISGSNIVFSTAPAPSLTFSGKILGPAVPVDYANNGNVYTRNAFTATAGQTVFTITGTYTVGYIDVYQNGVRLTSGTDYTATNGTTFVLTTPANLNDEVESVAYKVATLVTTLGQLDNLLVTGISTFAGQINASNISASGIATIGNVKIGTGSTTLIVNGDARITGILTIGTASITLDGNNNQVNVGSAVTINSSGIRVVGVITATSFSGNLTGSVNISSGITTVAAGSTSAPSITPTGDSNTGIFFPSADTIAFSDGGAEAMRIDSSSRLLLGTSSARSNFFNGTFTPSPVQIEGSTFGTSLLSITCTQNGTEEPGLLLSKARGTNGLVSNGDLLGSIIFSGADGTELVEAASIKAAVDGTPGANDMPCRLVFSTTADGASSPTERMRIRSDGRHVMFGSTYVLFALSADAAGTVNTLFTGRSTATSIGADDGTNRIFIFTNGNVQNSNNSYAGISDLKLKENIVDANSQWNDLKALQVRNYNFKEETGQQVHTQIGLIAQEVEQVSPGLVYESPDRDEEGNDLGTVTKSVNYSVLYMKAVKALQEAMERIETLEQRLTDAGIA